MYLLALWCSRLHGCPLLCETWGFRRTDLKVSSLFLLRITGRGKRFLLGLIPCTNLNFRVLPSSACSVFYTLATGYFHIRRTEHGVKRSHSAHTRGRNRGNWSWRLMPEAAGREVESSSLFCKSDDWLFQSSQRTCSYCGCVKTLYLAGLGDVWSDDELGQEGFRDSKMTRRIANMI